MRDEVGSFGWFENEEGGEQGFRSGKAHLTSDIDNYEDISTMISSLPSSSSTLPHPPAKRSSALANAYLQHLKDKQSGAKTWQSDGRTTSTSAMTTSPSRADHHPDHCNAEITTLMAGVCEDHRQTIVGSPLSSKSQSSSKTISTALSSTSLSSINSASTSSSSLTSSSQSTGIPTSSAITTGPGASKGKTTKALIPPSKSDILAPPPPTPSSSSSASSSPSSSSSKQRRTLQQLRQFEEKFPTAVEIFKKTASATVASTRTHYLAAAGATVSSPSSHQNTASAAAAAAAMVGSGSMGYGVAPINRRSLLMQSPSWSSNSTRSSASPTQQQHQQQQHPSQNHAIAGSSHHVPSSASSAASSAGGRSCASSEKPPLAPTPPLPSLATASTYVSSSSDDDDGSASTSDTAERRVGLNSSSTAMVPYNFNQHPSSSKAAAVGKRHQQHRALPRLASSKKDHPDHRRRRRTSSSSKKMKAKKSPGRTKSAAPPSSAFAAATTAMSSTDAFEPFIFSDNAVDELGDFDFGNNVDDVKPPLKQHCSASGAEKTAGSSAAVVTSNDGWGGDQAVFPSAVAGEGTAEVAAAVSHPAAPDGFLSESWRKTSPRSDDTMDDKNNSMIVQYDHRKREELHQPMDKNDDNDQTFNIDDDDDDDDEEQGLDEDDDVDPFQALCQDLVASNDNDVLDSLDRMIAETSARWKAEANDNKAGALTTTTSPNTPAVTASSALSVPAAAASQPVAPLLPGTAGPIAPPMMRGMSELSNFPIPGVAGQLRQPQVSAAAAMHPHHVIQQQWAEIEGLRQQLQASQLHSHFSPQQQPAPPPPFPMFNNANDGQGFPSYKITGDPFHPLKINNGGGGADDGRLCVCENDEQGDCDEDAAAMMAAEQIDHIPVEHIEVCHNRTNSVDDLTVWSGWTQPNNSVGGTHTTGRTSKGAGLTNGNTSIAGSSISNKRLPTVEAAAHDVSMDLFVSDKSLVQSGGGPSAQSTRRVCSMPLSLSAANGRVRKALYTGPVVIPAETGAGNSMSSSGVPRATGIGFLKFTETGDTYYGDIVNGEMHGTGVYTFCAVSKRHRRRSSSKNNPATGKQDQRVLRGTFEHNVFTGWDAAQPGPSTTPKTPPAMPLPPPPTTKNNNNATSKNRPHSVPSHGHGANFPSPCRR